MYHQIRVTLNNGKVVAINVKRNPKLVEAIMFGILEVIQKLRKSITKMVDTYCWSKAEYVVSGQVEGTITAI
jgi:hypothetical protein